MDMKATVIGHWGGYPKKQEASSGYLLEHDGFKLLVDCGSGVLSHLPEDVQPEQLDAVVLSHYHADHIADIGVLQHACIIQKHLGNVPKLPLPIYGHTKQVQEFQKLTYKDLTKGIPYNENEPVIVGPFTITFCETIHPVPCYAMRIEAAGKVLVYTADTAYHPRLASFAKEADVLLCECNFYAGMNGAKAGHMTSTDAGRMAREAQVKQLVLTHLPHFGDIQQLLKEAGSIYEGPIMLAEKGLTIQM
jgi:ribonuclease BN (tRNA processing enzyme)